MLSLDVHLSLIGLRPGGSVCGEVVGYSRAKVMHDAKLSPSSVNKAASLGFEESGQRMANM